AAGLSKEGSETTHEDTQDIAKLPPATRLTRGPIRIPDVRRLETPTHSVEPRLDWGGLWKPGLGRFFEERPLKRQCLSESGFERPRKEPEFPPGFSLLPR